MLNVLTYFLFGTECSWRQQNLFWKTVNTHLGGGHSKFVRPLNLEDMVFSSPG